MIHPLLDLDRHGALKPPLPFWLCAVFLIRHWLLLVLIASSWLGPADNIAWAYELLSWPMLAIESPVLLLTFAAMRRVPEGGLWARTLWRHGRELVTLTAAMSTGWALWYLAAQDVWNPVPERLVAALALADAAIAVGLWRSRLYRELFGDFPAAQSAERLSG